MVFLIKIILAVVSLPLFAFFCLMTLPVMLFVLPSIFTGNPVNIVFFIMWIVGGFSLYSLIKAITLVGMQPYSLSRQDQVGIGLGIIIFAPLTLLSPSVDLEWGVRILACASVLPSCSLLIYSIKGGLRK